jgi:hypothetical protein
MDFASAVSRLDALVLAIADDEAKVDKALGFHWTFMHSLTDGVTEARDVSGMSLADKRDLLIRSCRELVNQDMCSYIATGSNPREAQQMAIFLRSL